MFDADITAYIKAHVTGLKSVTFDFQPDEPDTHATVFVYASPLSRDGSLTRYMQIQVRDKSPARAQELCWEVSQLLDSGDDEELINLTAERHCICRPSARPKLMYRDAMGRAVYYTEIALTGEDIP